jgi:two-component system, cell cycle sensor histidine kinase and response regulator CckA
MPIFGLHPEGLLETIFEEIGVALAVVDQQQNLVFANRVAIELLGGAERPVTFREWHKHYRLEDAEGHEISMENSPAMRALRGERVETQEVRAFFPNGSSKWLLVWAYPFSAMGMSGVIVIAVDESIEVGLRRAVSQLQRMESLGAVAAGLTHNLNNVLDTITLSAELARRENCSLEECQGYLTQISAAATRAADLVRRLMQFGRTQEMQLDLVQINDVVSGVLQLVRSLLRENVALKIDLSPDLPLIKADAPQIEQVLINLIVNALDAMPHGGELRISTAVEPGVKTLGGTKTHTSVSITVADTGVGIPEELQSLIFDPFFTTKPAGKGTGLGLSSVYGIVRQHKGSIKVNSSPGVGSAFAIFLPVEMQISMQETAAD